MKINNVVENELMKQQIQTWIESENYPEIPTNEKSFCSQKSNALKLQSDENRSSNPVRLCPSLYVDIAASLVETTQHKFDSLMKFAMVGTESFYGMLQLFRMVEKMEFCGDFEVRFYFGKSRGFKCTRTRRFDPFLVKMVTIAAPHAVEIEFHDDDEWCDIVFNSLAKNAEQTRLRISCLPKVTDLAKTVLETMVQKGVCLELGFLDDEVLKNMPPCHFESLELWKIVSLTKSNCTFRKLKLSEIIPNDFACVPVDFHADYVEEIVIKQSEDVVPIEDLFPNLKRIFPKADKLTVTIDVDFYDVKHTLFTSGNLAYYSSGEFLFKVKEAVEAASQSNINLNLRYLRSYWYRIDISGGEDVGDNLFEWKFESSDKKTVRLEILKGKAKDYESDGSDDID